MCSRYKYGCDVPIKLRQLPHGRQIKIDNFNCGDHDFNEQIIDSVFDREAVSYVFVDAETDDKVAYAAIACAGVLSSIDGYTVMVPAVRITHFAVDEKYQGLEFNSDHTTDHVTLSHVILLYLLKRIRKLTRNCIGARYVVVDSVDRAVHFYQYAGFQLFPDYLQRDPDPYLDQCIPMFYLIEED